ncbi:MAG TPA: FixH family protein [Polyangia bacterium]|nr:FixH family protein [Polyangia bacterium]
MNGRRGLSLVVGIVVGMLGLLAAGCGGQAGTPSAPVLDFPGAPALTVASASGQLTIQIWWSPLQPTVGYDAAQLAITDATGAPVTGLGLTVVPFMPAHGHGASVEPTITETAPGVYVATPLDFFMAGNWELMTAISRPAGDAGGAEAIDDSAEPTVEVP